MNIFRAFLPSFSVYTLRNFNIDEKKWRKNLSQFYLLKKCKIRSIWLSRINGNESFLNFSTTNIPSRIFFFWITHAFMWKYLVFHFLYFTHVILYYLALHSNNKNTHIFLSVFEVCEKPRTRCLIRKLRLRESNKQ